MTASKLLLVTLALLLFSCVSASSVTIGDKAPSFQAVTLTGQTVSLADVKQSKAMVLVFWSTWCPFCEAAIPEFKDVYAKYAQKGVLFLAINPGVNDSLRKTQLYVEKFGISYPVVYEERGSISRSFGINGVPTVIMVDNTETILYSDAVISPDLLKRLDSIVN
jgi:peroxiredoxin